MTRLFGRRGARVIAPLGLAVSLSALVLLCEGVSWPWAQAEAQDADSAPDAATDAPAPVKKRKPKPKPKPVVHSQPAVAADSAAPPVAAPQLAAATPPAAGQDFAARLGNEGAGACKPQLNALALTTMGNVAQFNTSVSWAKSAQDKRLVTLMIGQKYPNGSIAEGLTSVVAAPSPTGGCDAVATQVLPSPLSCANIAGNMVAKGARQVGDLVGVTMLQDQTGVSTMLLPTNAGTCVLIGTRLVYAK